MYIVRKFVSESHWLLIANALICCNKIAKLSEKIGELSIQNGNYMLQIPTFRGQTYFAQEFFKGT